jgi:iron complex outermembrane receptor protein
MTRSPVAFALAALTFAPLHLDAQNPDSVPADSVVLRMQGIDVRAERPITLIGGATALDVDVERLDLSPAATVEDVFRQIPGLGVRTNSRGQAEITVRGSESRQVAVLLDGAPLTLAWDARTDVSVLPATALRNVRFVRGLSTVLRGPNVLGGVVELNLTDDPTPGSSVAIGVDQLGGWSTSATTTRIFAEGAGVIRAGAGWRDAPAVTLPDGVNERDVAVTDRRLNTDFENVDGFVAARYTGDSGAWVSSSLTAHRSERGIAAELGTDDARFWRYPGTTRSVATLRAGTGDRPTAFGSGRVEAGLFLDSTDEEIVAYTGPGYTMVEAMERGEGRTLTGRVRADHSVGGRGTVRASVDYGIVNHDTRFEGEERSYQQRLSSAGAETEWDLVRGGARFDRITASAGAVLDRATTPESGDLPSLGTIDDWGARLGLSATVNQGRTLFHAGVSRRGRFPSLRESYSEALNTFVPNPDLGSEHLVAFEAGVTTAMGDGELQIVGFRHDLTDAIRRITFPDGRRQRVNSDELESIGVEMFVSQRFGRVSTGGDLRLQAVELTDPSTLRSSEPENVPEREARAWAEWTPVPDLRVRGEAAYTGSQFCQDPSTGEDVELDGGTWLNAVVSRVWAFGGVFERLETALRASNLMDTALYDQCGLPRPGRTMSVQVRLY